MADAPNPLLGGAKPRGANASTAKPTSVMSGKLGVIGFFLLLGIIAAGIYVQLPRFADQSEGVYGIAGSGGSPGSGGDPLANFWRAVFPGLSRTPTPATLPAEGTISPELVPPGFTLSDIAPYFRKVRVVSYTAQDGDGGELLVRNELRYPIGLSGWIVQGSFGSQLIGLEGQQVIRDVSVPMRSGVIAPAHDRILLFDPRGKLVDEYRF